MGNRQAMQALSRGLARGASLVVLALCLALLAPCAAHADELSAVKEKINAQVEELKGLSQEVKQAKQRVQKLDDEIEQTLDDIDQKQSEYAQLQSSAANMAVELYKDSEDFSFLVVLERSTSMEELMRHLDMNERVLESYVKAVKKTAAARDELNEKYRKISVKKDEKAEILADLQKKAAKLESSIADLREKEEKLLSVEQQIELAQAAAAAQQVAQTFETGTVGLDDNEWQTGITTAYGGSSDDSTPNPGETATGTICDDWSVGVAVPMAWGPEQYYGRRVEISYDGQSIIAPIVDCGYMGNGYVSFDLQPGVFKAFGCDTCDDWGAREVQYRFV